MIEEAINRLPEHDREPVAKALKTLSALGFWDSLTQMDMAVVLANWKAADLPERIKASGLKTQTYETLHAFGRDIDQGKFEV